MKILAIQFKYLGDAVLITPALRAIKEHFPKSALHVLVAEEVVPVLQFLPFVDRVWAFPRKRGKPNLKQAWPLIRELRRERFDRSVDFAGNDRGATLSFLCGAPERLACSLPGGFWGRRFCYTQTIQPVKGQHEVAGHLRLLSAWGIASADAPRPEVRSDPGLTGAAERLLPGRKILCHLATSQPKKEWPLDYWAEFYTRAIAAGHEPVFSTGTNAREQMLLAELKQRIPSLAWLPRVPDLATFLAVIKRARLFIGGSTGPLHLAAGLGVPTLSLFGPSPASQWAPVGPRHRAVQGGPCTCGNSTQVCLSANPCMARISPEEVLRVAGELLKDEAR
jgi:ADP-heptose:LPS heptosyltransferase